MTLAVASLSQEPSDGTFLWLSAPKPIVLSGDEALHIGCVGQSALVIQDRKTVAQRIESASERNFKQRAWIKGENSGHIEQAI